MSIYLKKKNEALQDIKRYIKILNKEEGFEQREFFIHGIINIDEGYNHDRLWNRINIEKLDHLIRRSPYDYQFIAQMCAIQYQTIVDFLEGKIPTNKTLKKMYIGLHINGV